MSGLISKEVIEQIRAASDIVEVIGEYVQLKKAGMRYKALSPFNKEKTPSFFVDPARQFFKCFSSGHGGDVFKFIQVYENLDFPGAARRLAQRANIVIPEEAYTDEGRKRGQREKLLDLHAAVAAWWRQQLHKDPAAQPARDYLKSRKINSDLAHEFSLGYAPDSWEATLSWASKQGYDMDLLELAGLVTRGERNKPYDRFRGRLMFPIKNETGQVVAFSGRLLDPVAKAAKYVNSPETPLFSKSRILFGLDKTRRAILDEKRAIVCEGQIDLIRCYEHGVRNVVAAQGTAFTEEHGRILKRYADEVVLCFDADRAGQDAAERSIDTLLQSGLGVRIAQMPQGEDPDTLLLSDRKAEFHRLIDSAPDYTRAVLEDCCRQFDIASPKGRSLVAEKMAGIVKKIASPVQQEIVANEVAARLQIPLAAFMREMEKIKKTATNRESVEISAAETLEADPTIAQLLCLLLNNPGIVAEAQRQLDHRWLDGLPGGELLTQLLDSHAHDTWEDIPSYLQQQNEAARNFLTGLLLEPLPMDSELEPGQLLAGLCQALGQKWRLKRIALLEQEVKSPLLSDAERLARANELLDLRRNRG
jgi:DNA primase